MGRIMNNILLTGSNGFVGKYFLNNYKKEYNISTFSFRDNVPKGISFSHSNDLNLNNIDSIIHLSALVHQMGGASKEEYEKINVRQTLDLAKKAKISGVKHFIFMSTIKVYGEESELIYKESSNCKPKDDYGKSKLRAERELLELEDEDFIVSIIRTPIVYGYGVKANIKNLIKLVSKLRVLPFYNTNNKRSMVYIGNLYNLIDTIIIKEKSGIFLACDDESISTSRLVELIGKALGKKIYLIKIPFFESLLKTFKPSFYKRLYGSLEVDNTLTKEILGLKNPYTVEEGIELMINQKSTSFKKTI